MILFFVLVGFVTGTLGAVTVVSAGGGVLWAILAYSLGGAVGVVLTALLIALAPSFPRPRPRGGLPANAVPARRVAHRPTPGHARLHIHASRR